MLLYSTKETEPGVHPPSEAAIRDQSPRAAVTRGTVLTARATQRVTVWAARHTPSKARDQSPKQKYGTLLSGIGQYLIGTQNPDHKSYCFCSEN